MEGLHRPSIDDEVITQPSRPLCILTQQISEITGWYAYFVAKELLEESLNRNSPSEEMGVLTIPPLHREYGNTTISEHIALTKPTPDDDF